MMNGEDDGKSEANSVILRIYESYQANEARICSIPNKFYSDHF